MLINCHALNILFLNAVFECACFRLVIRCCAVAAVGTG